jgi:hypothetical protein
VRRSFTIAVMLCIALAGGAQAQSNGGSKKPTLTDLEAQSKAKKKTPAAKTTAKSTTRKPAATKKAGPAEPTTAAPEDASAAAAPAQGSATAPAAAPAAAAPADAVGPRIYKAGDIPDDWKFKKEKPAPKPAETPTSTKPVTEGAEAPMAAAPAAAAAVQPTTSESSAAAPTAAAPAAPAPAAPAPTAAAPTAAVAAPAAAQSQPAKPQPAPAKPAPVKPAPAPAKKPAGSNAQQWRDRGYISGNFGWQASSTSFSDTRTLPVVTGDVEPRHLTSNYEVKAGPMFDIGAGFRLWKSLGVAVAVTRFSVSNDVAVSGTVPSPIFFNRDRALSGTAPGTREELAVHVDAVWVVVPNKKLQIAIFGGPTFFNAKQTIVSDFNYTDTYPYDNPPVFDSAVSSEESKSVTGFNVGADVGYFFNQTFGVGGVIRFGRGTLKSSIGDLDVGGPQVSGGIRIRLPQGKAAPKPPAKTPPPPAKPANKKK